MVTEMAMELAMVIVVAQPFDSERMRRQAEIGSREAATETNIPYLSTEPLSYLSLEQYPQITLGRITATKMQLCS